MSSLEILTNDTYAVFVDAMHPGMTPKRFCETEVRHPVFLWASSYTYHVFENNVIFISTRLPL